MGIGKTLSCILEEKNSNANELAEKINVSPSTIYSIIKRDNTKVDIEVLIKICMALNVDIDRFYREYFTEDELKPKAEEPHFSRNEQRIIDLFKNLDDIQQENIISKAELLVEQNAEHKNTVKVYRAARSSDHHEDGMVEMPIEQIKEIQNAEESDEDI